MTTVEKIMQGKANEIWTVGPDVSVFDAIKMMDKHSVGALPVVQDNKLVGILSERDYARKVILKDRSSKTTLVKEIMTSRVFYTHPQQNIEECMAVMSEHKIRHLPVLEEGKLIGVISIGDVVKDIISEQQYKIEQLENTISWSESY